MNELAGLLKREWLEHRNTFIFPPAIVLALIILVVVVGIVVGEQAKAEIDLERHDFERPSFQQQVPPRPQAGVYMVSAQALSHEQAPDPWVASPPRAVPAVDSSIWDAIAGEHGAGDGGEVFTMLDTLGIPFFFVLTFVSLFAAISLTFDERKDRSLLFWKSMPVTDSKTILSKFLFLAWVAPLVTVACLLFARFLLAAVATIYSDDLGVLDVWGSVALWAGSFGVIGGYLLLGLWVAPIYAWLMLAGAAAPRSPMLIATLVPLVLAWLEWQFLDTTHFLSFFSRHALPSPVLNVGDGAGSLLGMLGSTELWGGAVIAALLLGATIVCRQRFNEV